MKLPSFDTKTWVNECESVNFQKCCIYKPRKIFFSLWMKQKSFRILLNAWCNRPFDLVENSCFMFVEHLRRKKNWVKFDNVLQTSKSKPWLVRINDGYYLASWYRETISIQSNTMHKKTKQNRRKKRNTQKNACIWKMQRGNCFPMCVFQLNQL